MVQEHHTHTLRRLEVQGQAAVAAGSVGAALARARPQRREVEVVEGGGIVIDRGIQVQVPADEELDSRGLYRGSTLSYQGSLPPVAFVQQPAARPCTATLRCQAALKRAHCHPQKARLPSSLSKALTQCMTTKGGAEMVLTCSTICRPGQPLHYQCSTYHSMHSMRLRAPGAYGRGEPSGPPPQKPTSISLSCPSRLAAPLRPAPPH